MESTILGVTWLVAILCLQVGGVMLINAHYDKRRVRMMREHEEAMSAERERHRRQMAGLQAAERSLRATEGRWDGRGIGI